MLSRKLKWFFPMFGIVLSLAACGQISVGLVTPADSNSQSEMTEVVFMELTPESTTLEPDSLPEITQEPESDPGVNVSSIPDMAYVGMDGNLWLLEVGSEAPRLLTFDANPIGGEDMVVVYASPRPSYDGALLAFYREVGLPTESGYDFTSALWVLDLSSGEKVFALDGRFGGMEWKPGTHFLAYAPGLEIEYFMTRGEPDAALATGIFGVDLDSGATEEVVAPERGFGLADPRWSSDGRFLAFAEVIGMEGSGQFAYYDFTAQAYFAWDEPIGFFSWSPNGGLLTYARHTYAATGEERLYLRGRVDIEQPIGPDYDGPAYATHPVFSPDGGRIAYLAFLEGPNVNIAVIMVLDLASGEVQSFGQFEGVWEMAWVPDGSHVVFNSGPWEARQIIAINLADGSQTVLAAGDQPGLAGR